MSSLAFWHAQKLPILLVSHVCFQVTLETNMAWRWRLWFHCQQTKSRARLVGVMVSPVLEIPSLECLWSIQSELCTRQLGRRACILGKKSELEIRLGNHHCITDPEEQRGKSREKGRVSRPGQEEKKESVRENQEEQRERETQKSVIKKTKEWSISKRVCGTRVLGQAARARQCIAWLPSGQSSQGSKPEGVSSGLKKWKQAHVRSKHWGMRMGGGGAPSPFPRGVRGAGPGQRLRPQEGREEKQSEEGTKERRWGSKDFWGGQGRKGGVKGDTEEEQGSVPHMEPRGKAMEIDTVLEPERLSPNRQG